MNRHHPDPTQALHIRTALVDAAKRRAEELRREAIKQFLSALVRAPVRLAARAMRLLRQRPAPVQRPQPNKA